MTMTPAEFRAARQSLGLTQHQMARLIGLGSFRRVSEIENGARAVQDAHVLLMRVYLSGWRPDNWPVDVQIEQA